MKLVDCKVNELFKGTILKFKQRGTYASYNESPIEEFMICLYPTDSQLALYCISGYYSGHLEYVFPKEARSKNSISIDRKWLVENWNNVVKTNLCETEIILE